ncbi:hypothetical protein BJ138DRAFT_456695 [Hygrophoropsis aurantiaca]|uniref:Uncharacterized protein n=1 Tax=Hygrophoropsis aurantiaca TaxID=72124 RepID=A0ACB8A2B0_9AGAM|nr:hypothetical protein BJ138DRAFT_456695 [Hygrophoropsis aurantiaca]
MNGTGMVNGPSMWNVPRMLNGPSSWNGARSWNGPSSLNGPDSLNSWNGPRLPNVPSLPHANTNRAVEMRHIRTSGISGRPFMFSNLQQTDDDAYLGSAPRELGEIVLAIWPVRIVGVAASTADPAPKQPVVHERAKKAYSHCVAFGDEVALPLSRVLSTARMGAAPFATFVFRYRPLERLIADGIAPPPPRPNKRSCSDTEDDRAGDEALRQVQVLTERVVQLEAELKGHRRASKRVKTEVTDEIIDLTG